ncbi:MAG: hypothetical protein IPF59_08070 [Ignavibacteria bacterium]|nr:hypothetical protein [Ignavibacteria bacterium]MBK6420287.1 hypothetical protein [Ignavibacteria bacterium]MBK7412761.1 hypothetical protein [Ignavibacteria bacterium]
MNILDWMDRIWTLRPRVLVIMIVVFVLILTISIGLPGIVKEEWTKWDSYGSWLSGVGAILLQSITLVLVVAVSVAQLRTSQRQLRLEHFFEMLRRYDDAVDRISYITPNINPPKTLVGRSVFEYLYGYVITSAHDAEKKVDWSMIHCNCMNVERSYGEWSRAINTLISYAGDQSYQEQRQYAKILRGYLSPFEALFLGVELAARSEKGSYTAAFAYQHQLFKYSSTVFAANDPTWTATAVRLKYHHTKERTRRSSKAGVWPNKVDDSDGDD